MNKLGKRLVFFPFPLLGHLNPMLELANVLHARGFSISVIHSRFNSPNRIKHPNFTYHSIDDGLTVDDTVSGHEMIAFIAKLNTTCIEPFRECLSGLMSSDSFSDSDPVACLIADKMWYFSQSVADRLELPRVVLITENLAAITGFASVPAFREKGDFCIQGSDQPEEPVMEVLSHEIRDNSRFKDCDPQQLLEVLSNILRQAKVSRGVIFNTFRELEEHMLPVIQKEFFSTPVFTVGPLHKCIPSSSRSTTTVEENRFVMTWLNSKSPNSVLYISFGSLAVIDRSQFTEMAWGVAESNQPFIWVVRSNLVHGTNESSLAFPNGFLEEVGERGCIVDWAPQKEVLAHPSVGGFWTHSGWNSTLESICEGVPMICYPCFADQMVNAACVTHDWKIGLQIETIELSKESVRNVIRRIMVEEEGEEMRKRAGCLKAAANAALVGEGSSCTALKRLIDFILLF